MSRIFVPNMGHRYISKKAEPSKHHGGQRLHRMHHIEGWINIQKQFARVECDEEYTGKSTREFREKLKEHLKATSPLYYHSNTRGHHTNINDFSIMCRES